MKRWVISLALNWATESDLVEKGSNIFIIKTFLAFHSCSILSFMKHKYILYSGNIFLRFFVEIFFQQILQCLRYCPSIIITCWKHDNAHLRVLKLFFYSSKNLQYFSFFNSSHTFNIGDRKKLMIACCSGVKPHTVMFWYILTIYYICIHRLILKIYEKKNAWFFKKNCKLQIIYEYFASYQNVNVWQAIIFINLKKLSYIINNHEMTLIWQFYVSTQ